MRAHCLQKLQVSCFETFVTQIENSFVVTAPKTFEYELELAEIWI